MSNSDQSLGERLRERFKQSVHCISQYGEITIEVSAKDAHSICLALRDEPEFLFEQLIDLCGVDYLSFGDVEWVTEDATGKGFSRGVERNDDGTSSHETSIHENDKQNEQTNLKRFAVVYHLLSIKHNFRLRVKTYLPANNPVVDTVTDIWSSANWYEREAFDLFGILFDSHSDLRRLLTDYGFIGHPFRKDFPLLGHVEMRYDTEKQRVIYEPVSVQPRTLVPKVKREDHRYINESATKEGEH